MVGSRRIRCMTGPVAKETIQFNNSMAYKGRKPYKNILDPVRLEDDIEPLHKLLGIRNLKRSMSSADLDV
jgi:hypothetical protein